MKFKTSGKLLIVFRGIYRIYLDIIKKDWKIATCNWLDLETIGSWLIMPKNLPGYYMIKLVGTYLIKFSKRRIPWRVLHFTLVTKAHEKKWFRSFLWSWWLGDLKIMIKRDPLHVSKALVTRHSVKHVWTWI